MKKLLPLFALVACATVGYGQLLTVSGNFTASSPPFGFGPYYILSASETAGADPQDNWNNIHATSASDLDDHLGNPTTLDVSVTGYIAGWWGFYGASGSDNRMLGAFHETNGTGNSLTLALSEIPFALYDVYVYVGWNDDRPNSDFSVTLGSSTFYGRTQSVPTGGPGLVQATSTSSGSPTVGSTYVVFTGLTASSQSITLTVEGGPGTPGFGLSGFQVVQVPEPSTYALLLLGAAGLALLRRRANLKK